jgi:hypothetical protein
MATPINDDYFDYVRMLGKCHGEDLTGLTVEDIKIAQKAVRRSPISDGFFKVGTVTIDRTFGAIKRELTELNRMIDEMKK